MHLWATVDSCLCSGYKVCEFSGYFFVTMATLITLKLRKKNVLFTKAITSLIWVFLKFLVQRTETLLVLFRLPTEFFYGFSGFPLSSKKTTIYISVGFVSSLHRAKV